jgi:hypothetical protein
MMTLSSLFSAVAQEGLSAVVAEGGGALANSVQESLRAALSFVGYCVQELVTRAFHGLLLLVIAILTWAARLIWHVLSTSLALVADALNLSDILDSASSSAAGAAASISAKASAATGFTREAPGRAMSAVQAHSLHICVAFGVILATRYLRRQVKAARALRDARRYIDPNAWLAIPLKRPLSTARLADLAPPGAHDARGRLAALDEERESMVRRAKGAREVGAREVDCREAMGRYVRHAMACKVMAVFSRAELEGGGVLLHWGDAWRWESEGIECASADWNFEIANALFNLAASLSQLALTQQVSGRYLTYQQAAFTLKTLSEMLAACGGWNASDLSADALRTLHALMLAQAQRCLYEQAVAQGLSKAVQECAAARCADAYAEAASFLQASSGAPFSSLSSEWADIPGRCAWCYDGLSQLHAASKDDSESRYGDAVARLAHAATQCGAAAHDAPAKVKAHFEELGSRASAEHVAAQRANDTVIFAEVPESLHSLRSPSRAKIGKAEPKAPPELEGSTADTLSRLLASPAGQASP